MDNHGLYIHIPFCRSKCHYCDFNRVLYDERLAANYLDALAIEFAARAHQLHPATIYIGGGTPTCLPHEQLEQLLSLLDFVDLDGVREFTVEANPGTLDVDKLILLRDAGVTRMSIGAQTFNERGLELLGRKHHAKAARYAVALLQETGVADISLDFIFGWSGQTADEWREDLRLAIALGANHLSCYGLTYADHTPLAEKLHRGEIRALSEDAELTLFNLTADILGGAGYERYEISNFARAGKFSRHNVNYWQGGTYTGLGAGAHSYENGVRFNNAENVTEYIELLNTTGAAKTNIDDISPLARARESGAIWLRLKDGIDNQLFRVRTGFALRDIWRQELPPLLDDGWLEWHNDCLRLTPRAIPLADSVLVELI